MTSVVQTVHNCSLSQKKWGIQSIRGFRFLWDLWTIGCPLFYLFTLSPSCVLIVSSCVFLSLCLTLSLFHSTHTLSHTKHIETVCKGIKVISPDRVSLGGLSLLLSPLLWNTKKTSNILFMFHWLALKMYQGFSSLNITKKKNKPSNG